MKIADLIKKRRKVIDKSEISKYNNNHYIKVISQEDYKSRFVPTKDGGKKEVERVLIVYYQYNKIGYEDLVGNLIKEKYSINDQIALIRQKDIKKDEYEIFYNFCELCKEQARQYIVERESIK